LTFVRGKGGWLIPYCPSHGSVRALPSDIADLQDRRILSAAAQKFPHALQPGATDGLATLMIPTVGDFPPAAIHCL